MTYWTEDRYNALVREQATIQRRNDIKAKKQRMLMSLWLSSGKAATMSFHEWNTQRIDKIVMKWFK